MKFRYKILLINLILLSLALGIAGYLIIARNFELARDTQVKNAVMENNLKQASVEYEVLQRINNNYAIIGDTFSEIGKQVASDMLSVSNSFYIRYGGEYVYASDDKERTVPEKLFDRLTPGAKECLIQKEADRYFIYVTSYSRIEETDLSVVSRSDISELYRMLDEQIAYFRILLVVVLLIMGLVLYQVSAFLTGPLEELNRVAGEIADGHYAMRVPVNANDEAGQLAASFNRMAQAVEEHVAKLEDMVSRREQFVADFIHEVKTPMTAIIGYADTMRSMKLTEEEEFDALNYIFFEGKRLEKMSGKLFELIYLGKHEIHREPCHTSDLSEELQQIVMPMLERNGMEFQADCEPAMVKIDRELMITVFVNLIDNARKASKQGDVIEFQGEIWQNGYKWFVRDHGIGMSKEDCEHICDEFYMADKSRSRAAGGAGLGMSLVALIVKRHGAELAVESTQGIGTQIEICLPEEKEGEEK